MQGNVTACNHSMHSKQRDNLGKDCTAATEMVDSTSRVRKQHLSEVAILALNTCLPDYDQQCRATKHVQTNSAAASRRICRACDQPRRLKDSHPRLLLLFRLCNGFGLMGSRQFGAPQPGPTGTSRASRTFTLVAPPEPLEQPKAFSWRRLCFSLYHDSFTWPPPSHKLQLTSVDSVEHDSIVKGGLTSCH